MAERSLLALESYKNAQSKFDYFILGVIGALCAYLSQSMVFKPLGVNSSTLELLSLLVILSSGVLGFLRIETIVNAFMFNHHILHLQEKKGKLVKIFDGGPLLNSSTGEVMSAEEAVIEVQAIEKVIPDAKLKLEVQQKRGVLYYKYRNTSLLVGFIFLLISKVWGAYA